MWIAANEVTGGSRQTCDLEGKWMKSFRKRCKYHCEMILIGQKIQDDTSDLAILKWYIILTSVVLTEG